jgi:hypothetical protein
MAKSMVMTMGTSTAMATAMAAAVAAAKATAEDWCYGIVDDGNAGDDCTDGSSLEKNSSRAIYAATEEAKVTTRHLLQ